MLQDTDLFDKLASYSNVGEDVPVSITWEESPGPDERYDVELTWKFRGKQVGTGHYVIGPVFGHEDKFELFWLHLEFIEKWQDKGLYSALVKSYKASLPSYGIDSVVAVVADAESEKRLASQGFAWTNNQFVLDLTEPS